jgi:hypothetical protein
VMKARRSDPLSTSRRRRVPAPFSIASPHANLLRAGTPRPLPPPLSRVSTPPPRPPPPGHLSFFSSFSIFFFFFYFLERIVFWRALVMLPGPNINCREPINILRRAQIDSGAGFISRGLYWLAGRTVYFNGLGPIIGT